MPPEQSQNPDQTPGPCPRTAAHSTTYVTRDPTVQALLQRAELVAMSQAPVLITGESGTGKDVVARYIHEKSGKSAHPLIAVNCAALPQDVIDNELFGHEREAFTGAHSKKAGCFELAHLGTLFLDEIAEMPPAVQAKLLRALETKRFRRLGGSDEVEVDVRIVAATNRDIAQALSSGQLREDVYYRLRVVDLHLPPLRERPGDIELLLDHFTALFCRKAEKPLKEFDDESLEILNAYAWPGNVRELRNMVEGIVITCPHRTITPRNLPERMNRAHVLSNAITIPVGSTIQEVEQMMIEYTLQSTGGNKSKTAQILGVSRKYLYERLRGTQEQEG